MKDTFHLWAHQDKASGKITWAGARGESRLDARYLLKDGCRVVKLECRIVPRKSKPKRSKYPNDNFGLPAGYTPHNPDNLTREQVGEGFRLLADVEIWSRSNALPHIQNWDAPFGPWDETGWHGSVDEMTYRVPINTPLDINPELKTR